ncbi:alpha/beta hydrolase [Muricoccus pecuniae]|uniref:Acetyl esterase/lipase n=1 Tax=Muricoccus pecuniae TaxID=693023 RepID=A0A840YMF7_9PROT|nr:alpha/beta hydrolase [Roseomonas pecuniae]MBB5696193.1 acetyl esterase/lipase [Roseomonas pecuniae]
MTHPTLLPGHVALSLLLASADVEAGEGPRIPRTTVVSPMLQERDRHADHLTPDGRLGDILEHPAFTGFARLILPWDGKTYDSAMPLRQIGSLLPYHSHVDPVVVTRALNRMIDDVRAGRRVFYDFYDAAARRADPEKENTGLFFFHGRPGAPFAIVAPGGGFSYVGSVHEGFPYAQDISAAGYNAFVLRYRAGHGGRMATEDLAAALTYVFRNAGALGVSTEGYSLWGSSAGARMAASIGSHGAASFGGDDLPRPSTVVMAYTGHSDHSSEEPPTFVVVGGRDGIAPPSSMERRVAALQRARTPVEYRRYEGLGHGFGTGAGTRAEGWIAEAVRFWQAQLAGRGGAAGDIR